MRKRCLYSIFALLSLTSMPMNASSLVLCGGAQVTVMHVTQIGKQPSLQEDWHWRPEESSGLPIPIMRKFITTDDCKPVLDGKQLLITSSGGAVALVSYPSGKTLFYANVANAHSAELLPGGLIAVAASDDPTGQGDRILLFDIRQSDTMLASMPLKEAHGVVWDSQRHLLWALGGEELLSLMIDHSERTAMQVRQRVRLPAPVGHDLQLIGNGSSLLVSNTKEVFLVDPDSLSFKPYLPLADRKGVKSVSVDPASQQLAFTQADAGVWWTYTLRFQKPSIEISLPWLIYKVRWLNSGQTPSMPWKRTE